MRSADHPAEEARPGHRMQPALGQAHQILEHRFRRRTLLRRRRIPDLQRLAIALIGTLRALGDAAPERECHIRRAPEQHLGIVPLQGHARHPLLGGGR
jgi:hypothetical protein